MAQAGPTVRPRVIASAATASIKDLLPPPIGRDVLVGADELLDRALEVMAELTAHSEEVRGRVRVQG